MSCQKKYIGARYAEDLIEYFMRSYELDWQSSCGLSKNLEGVPVLFTPEIGRTAFIISQIYQYGPKVEASAVPREYFFNESIFYLHVTTVATEYLNKPDKMNFFHMSAFLGEVAVFCHLQKFSNLHVTLIAAVMCVLDANLRLDLEKSRIYYQELAKRMDDERNDRIFYETNAVSENQSSSNENQGPNPKISSGYSSHYSRNAYIAPSQMFNLPNSTVNTNTISSQVQRPVVPQMAHCFPGASFPYSLPPPRLSFPVPENIVSTYTYPTANAAQRIPACTPAPQAHYLYPQYVPEYFHPGILPGPAVPSVKYHTKGKKELHTKHIKQKAVSSSFKTPKMVKSYSLMNVDDSTKPSSVENNTATKICNIEYPQNNQNLHALNVNAPLFVHSSEKSIPDNPMTHKTATHSKTNGATTASSESKVSTIASPNENRSEASNDYLKLMQATVSNIYR